ncbi:MAG: methyltransferase domain-containing protein, partial [bacterium]
RRAAVSGAPSLAFHQMSAESLDFPDGTFDFIVSVTALHHADLPRALAEVRRVLRPGGRFLSVDIFAYFFGMRRQPPWLTWLTTGVDFAENVVRDGPRAAWQSLRAVTTPEWLDHLNHDGYLPAPEFDAAYAAHLPGATFGRASRYFRYCLWDKRAVWASRRALCRAMRGK